MSNQTKDKTWKIEKRQHILESAFQLFAAKGIDLVTMPEIAEASGIGRATLFRYFPSKLDLVIAIGANKWDEYIQWHESLLTPEESARMSGAQRLDFYMNAFLDLYRNHKDILRFNYSFNSFLSHENTASLYRQPYLVIVHGLGEIFHEIYQRGSIDGTLNTNITEASMFSASFHIMLAAATRYAVGLVYVPENIDPPEDELLMLKELLLSRFVKQKSCGTELV